MNKTIEQHYAEILRSEYEKSILGAFGLTREQLKPSGVLTEEKMMKTWNFLGSPTGVVIDHVSYVMCHPSRINHTGAIHRLRGANCDHLTIYDDAIPCPEWPRPEYVPVEIENENKTL